MNEGQKTSGGPKRGAVREPRPAPRGPAQRAPAAGGFTIADILGGALKIKR